MSEQLLHDLQRLLADFAESGCKTLRVESSNISLLLSSDPAEASLGGQGSVPPAQAVALAAQPTSPAPAVVTAAAPVVAEVSTGAIDPAWVAVVAPNLGTFYRSPKPGAAPFVEIGQKVTPETEVCLIEVMKLFTSVKAGVSGTVRHAAAADAELVEGGQVLLYIERD